VLGDPDALKQVLLIVLDNALKYTPGAISMTTDITGEQLVLRIKDSGPGITPDVVPRVFDRFFRAEASSVVPGYGLGLPIAKALIEGLGGAISIESQPGNGSTVTIRLPLAPG
jgi:signal transduction histidine kinase